jgi:hypothetical protein
VRVLPRAERTTVARLPVQHVVQSLGDREERRVAVQDQPSVVDAGALAVGEHRLQHLPDPTSMGGGVHVPDRAVAEGRPSPLRRGGEPLGPVSPEKGRERLEIDGPDVDLLHGTHALVYAGHPPAAASRPSPPSNRA